MPRALQYADPSQEVTSLVPLLALHEMQHLAMFSRVTIRASLTMCSHDGRWCLVELVRTNSIPQYTQCRSRSTISRSNQSGIFHRFTAHNPLRPRDAGQTFKLTGACRGRQRTAEGHASG
jgi:hypothetical protein